MITFSVNKELQHIPPCLTEYLSISGNCYERTLVRKHLFDILQTFERDQLVEYMEQDFIRMAYKIHLNQQISAYEEPYEVPLNKPIRTPDDEFRLFDTIHHEQASQDMRSVEVRADIADAMERYAELADFCLDSGVDLTARLQKLILTSQPRLADKTQMLLAELFEFWGAEAKELIVFIFENLPDVNRYYKAMHGKPLFVTTLETDYWDTLDRRTARRLVQLVVQFYADLIQSQPHPLLWPEVRDKFTLVTFTAYARQTALPAILYKTAKRILRQMYRGYRDSCVLLPTELVEKSILNEDLLY